MPEHMLSTVSPFAFWNMSLHRVSFKTINPQYLKISGRVRKNKLLHSQWQASGFISSLFELAVMNLGVLEVTWDKGVAKSQWWSYWNLTRNHLLAPSHPWPSGASDQQRPGEHCRTMCRRGGRQTRGQFSATGKHPRKTNGGNISTTELGLHQASQRGSWYSQLPARMISEPQGWH